MGRRCVAGGCSNTKANNVSLHDFPSDQCKRKLWERFVQQRRRDFLKSTPTSVLCSAHFTDDNFESPMRLAFGLKRYRTLLKGAVPTMHVPPKEHTQRPGRAIGKLTVNRVSVSHSIEYKHHCMTSRPTPLLCVDNYLNVVLNCIDEVIVDYDRAQKTTKSDFCHAHSGYD